MFVTGEASLNELKVLPRQMAYFINIFWNYIHLFSSFCSNMLDLMGKPDPVDGSGSVL